MNIDAKAREIAQNLSVADASDLEIIAIKATLLSVRNEALEEAARVAENPALKRTLVGSQDFMWGFDQGVHDIAAAIRSLKDGT
jgi:hypothetical protein